MPTAKVTFKGQVTIPKVVREQLGIREGDEVVFIPLGARAIIERLPRPSARQLRGVLASSQPYPGRDALRDQAEWVAAEEAEPYGGTRADKENREEPS